MEQLRQLELIFKKHQPGLFHFCMQYVKNKEDAHELVNDAFLAIWDKRDDLKIDESIKSYIYTVVRNKALNFLKKKKIEFTDFSDEMPTISNAPSATDYINAKETEVIVFLLIDKLSPKCKQIFLLSRKEEMSYKEIAAILEISEKTVENQIGIALKFIKSGLDKKQKQGINIVFWPWIALWLGKGLLETCSSI